MKKTYDLSKWLIVGISIIGLIFNSGILYNDVKHLSESVTKLEKSYSDLNGKFDILLLTLAKGENQ